MHPQGVGRRASPGTPERLTEALGLLEQAALGLIAAHERELVHRDFKPANVLVGDDGRVRVLDFGLARAFEAQVPSLDRQAPTLRASNPQGESDGDETLTRTGAAIGTPRYMSPEQHRGQRIDARGDQFAFAVSAWEVLYGQPPFEAKTLAGLLDAIDGRNPRGNPDAGVPRWMARALRKGFAPRSSRRFASMTSLIRGLSPQRRQRRQRWAGAAVLFAGVGGVVAAGRSPRTQDHVAPVCDDTVAEAEFAAVWTPERRSRLAEGFRGAGVAYAEDTAQGVEREVASFGNAWVSVYGDACRSPSRSEAGGEPEFNGRVRCLRLRLTTVDQLLRALEKPTPKSAERAIDAVRHAPAAVDCLSEQGNTGVDTPVHAALRTRLATAQADFLRADYETVVDAARAIAEEAEEADLDALVGDALELCARARDRNRDERAVDDLKRAYEIAVETGDAGRSAERARRVAQSISAAGEVAEARQWIRHAESALRRSGRAPDNDARIQLTQCRLLRDAGDLPGAIKACEHALTLDTRGARLDWSMRSTLASLYERTGQLHEARESLLVLRARASQNLGEAHPRVGGMTMNLGSVALSAGEFDEAIALFHQAADIFRVVYGPNHKWVVSCLMNIGKAHSQVARFEQASEAYEQALKAAGQTRNAQLARVLNNIGVLRHRQGRFEEALQVLRQVQILEAELLPSGHVQTAHSYHAVALTLAALGRSDAAAEAVGEAIRLRTPAGDTPDLASSWLTLGDVQEDAGRDEDARTSFRAALEILGRLDGPDPRALAHASAGLARVLVAQGEFEQARAPLAKAITLFQTDEAPARYDLARIHFVQAQVAAHDGRAEQANTQARAALAKIADLDIARAVTLRETIEAWQAR